MPFDSLARDLRDAIRALARAPGLTAVTVLTLAAGLGANTAIFSVTRAVLLAPLPYPAPDRLVRVWTARPTGEPEQRVPPASTLAWQAQTPLFDALGFWVAFTDATDFILVGPEGPDRIRGAYASGNLLATLGRAPRLGRLLAPADDGAAPQPVAVIGHDLWQRRFGGDPDIIGRTLTTDNFWRRAFTVVGVMPPRFGFPDGTELWVPAGWAEVDMTNRTAPWLLVLGRLAPGATAASAALTLTRLEQERAEPGDPGRVVVVTPLFDAVTGDARPGVLLLQGAAFLVLLVACVNVAILLLAAARSRGHDMAVRLALGGGRRRLLRQLLVESGARAAAGALLGLPLAVVALDALRRLGPDAVPRLAEARLDGVALGVTAAATVATALLAGLAPAWWLCGRDPAAALREGGRGAAGDRGEARTHRALLLTEVALTLMLVVGAGLLLRSVQRLESVAPGFDPEHLVTTELDLSGSGYSSSAGPGPNRPQVFTQRLLAELRALPGVDGAAASDLLPPSLSSTPRPIRLDAAGADGGDFGQAVVRAVTPDYFDVMGIPLLQGRGFTSTDTEATLGVAVINDTMARRVFRDRNPVGARLVNISGSRKGMPRTVDVVVGVVGDVKNAGLAAATQPEIYKPSFQWAWREMTVVLRTGRAPAELAAPVGAAVRRVNPDQPAGTVQSMETTLGAEYAVHRFRAWLVGLFGALALGLAAIGIYGVLDYRVRRSLREIAVRLALGATRRGIVRAVLGDSLRLVGAGLVLGLAGVAVLVGVIRSLLFEVSPLDPPTLVGSAAVVTLVALLAAVLAARRVTSVEPAAALRGE